MGQNKILTKEQKIILDEVGKNEFLRSSFYFTGGTALSEFYLQHRLSEDIDFFSQNRFDTQSILIIITNWSEKHKFTFEPRLVDPLYFVTTYFKNGVSLKLDFSYYPYKSLERHKTFDNINVDSLLDIAVNKTLTISQRNDVKDFVDLYFLLDQFSLWDLIEGVKVKFNIKIDPLLLASDLLKIEDFDYLPKMVKPLNLNSLKEFFRKQARLLGLKTVEI